jgi:predicted transcriptional regulator
MEVLWQLGSATVRDVHAALKTSRGLAYTTVMTVMDKLHRKGALQQQRRGRAYFYTVQLDRAEALHRRIQCLLDDYFDGSAEKLLTYLLEGFAPSPPAPTAARQGQPDEAPKSGDMDAVLL